MGVPDDGAPVTMTDISKTNWSADDSFPLPLLRV